MCIRDRMLQSSQSVAPVQTGGGTKSTKSATNAGSQLDQSNFMSQIALGKDALGDAYKNMRKFKLAN